MTTASRNDHASINVTPSWLLIGFVILSSGLDRLWPLQFITGSIIEVTGFAIAGLGMLLLAWASREFYRYRTTDNCRKSVSHLIVTGPFRYSRNPVYVALLTVITGMALAYGNLWMLLTVLPMGIALKYWVIVKEEAYLRREFKEIYARYCASVRRWV